LTGHAIEAVLITDRGGTPKFYMQLDPQAFGMDPVLASSFFAAIDMFSQQVFDQSTPVFQIDYGARVFTVIHGVETNLVAACIRRLDKETLDTLDSLLAEFELEWLPAAQSFDFDGTFTEVYLESFGEKLMKKLSFRDLHDSWVPYFTTRPDEITSVYSTISPYINGSRSVKEIRNVSGASNEEILLELSRLWAHRVIRFRDMLSFKDFLSARTEFLRYVQATSTETKDLQNLHPEMVGIIPRLAGLIDGRRTLHEILVELGGQYDERELLRVMDYLREKEVIEALSPEKRRILLVKEMFEVALRAAEKTYNEKEISDVLRSVMKSSDTPETLGQLYLKNDKWNVDFDFKILEGLSPKRLMVLYGEWMKILAQFTIALDRKNLDSFIAGLTKVVSQHIVNRYAAHDLIGMEEFAFWLEQLSTEKWPHVEINRTYPLEKIGSSILEDMVIVLALRGQTIYGSERIVGICDVSGIPLVDGVPVERVRQTRTEAFERFLLEYSKLSPAAELTLLILSRQSGISLPQGITY